MAKLLVERGQLSRKQKNRPYASDAIFSSAIPTAAPRHVQRGHSKDKALYGLNLSLLNYSPACKGFYPHEG